MSVTWNSSKHNSQACSKIARRGERDHVAVGDFAARDILAEAVDPLMHLGHEFVEMRAALVLDRTVLEKQVHQHGLAAADFAVNVEPARRRIVLVGEQPAEQALLAQRLVARKPLLEVAEGFRGLAPARRRARSRRRQTRA